MTKPHGRDCPTKCSLCAGAVPQKVEQRGPELLIDGELAGRPLNREDAAARRYYARRGGRARHNKTPRRTP